MDLTKAETGIIAFIGLTVVFVVCLLVQRLQYRRKQEEKRMSEERYLQALAGSANGIWD